jgi:rubrerythrin
MTIDLLKDRGTPLSRQRFTWRELAGAPYRKFNDDAFTRVRVILMNGIESEANRFSHAVARFTPDPALQLALAQTRRVEQHQQTMINWLNPADQNPLETTIGFEQVAIEITAAVAQTEPDPYLAQVYRFGLLEDFDHMYRFAALYDRLEGKDANTLLQSYTDILPGRPTSVEHRDPSDDLRKPYDKKKAAAITKMHAMTIMAAENQTHDYYMTIGPMFPDPTARALYAEIASIEEQHTTQYESIIDPSETMLEKWVLHEANEAYLYYSCAQSETNPRIRAIWERFLDYELGQLQVAREMFEKLEKRDVAAVLGGGKLPEPVAFQSQRQFVRETLLAEVNYRANGKEIVPLEQWNEDSPSHPYREQLNSEGSPSEKVAAGYVWSPGTELTRMPNKKLITPTQRTAN